MQAHKVHTLASTECVYMVTRNPYIVQTLDSLYVLKSDETTNTDFFTSRYLLANKYLMCVLLLFVRITSTEQKSTHTDTEKHIFIKIFNGKRTRWLRTWASTYCHEYLNLYLWIYNCSSWLPKNHSRSMLYAYSIYPQETSVSFHIPFSVILSGQMGRNVRLFACFTFGFWYSAKCF